MSTKNDLVTCLRSIWADLDRLTRGFSADQWRTPVLPGWDVKDTLAHVLGTEKTLEEGAERMRQLVVEAAAAGVPNDDQPHVRNAIGMTNEAWVEHYRSYSPQELIAEFRETTKGRIAVLETMSDADFESSAWTPAGEGTYASLMRIRVFDCWMHEQDIRYALGMDPGDGGAAAETALDEVVAALGFVVGKQGKAPAGTLVAIDLTGPVRRALYVEVTDRARVVTEPTGDPTVSLSLTSSLFMRLSGGRVTFDEVSDDIDIVGDLALGQQIASNLAFTV